MNKEQFKVIAYEPGFHSQALPTWTDRLKTHDVFEEEFDVSKVKRVDLSEVPGGFQLLNVLTETETRKLIDISEMLGYDEDSPVSLPHEVRHNENFNWVVSKVVDQTIWERSKHLITKNFRIKR